MKGTFECEATIYVWLCFVILQMMRKSLKQLLTKLSFGRKSKFVFSCTWHLRVIAKTGWLGVRIMCLGLVTCVTAYMIYLSCMLLLILNISTYICYRKRNLKCLKNNRNKR